MLDIRHNDFKLFNNASLPFSVLTENSFYSVSIRNGFLFEKKFRTDSGATAFAWSLFAALKLHNYQQPH